MEDSSYIEVRSTERRVGVYSPVGVDSAMEISACGRTVSVGLVFGSAAWVAERGVMEERRRGH